MECTLSTPIPDYSMAASMSCAAILEGGSGIIQSDQYGACSVIQCSVPLDSHGVNSNSEEYSISILPEGEEEFESSNIVPGACSTRESEVLTLAAERTARKGEFFAQDRVQQSSK